MNLMEAAVQYEAESGRLRTPASKKSFRKVMNTLDRFAGCPLDQVDAQTLTDWCLSNDVAPSTVKKRRAHARSFFGWCTWKGWLDADPSATLEYSVRPGKGHVRTHTWLSKADLVDLLERMPKSETGRRDRLILMCGAMLGLRAEEMCELRWSDFSLDFHELTLRVAKGSKPVSMGVPPELQAELRDWHTLRPRGARAVFPTIKEVYLPGKGRQKVALWDKPLAYHGVLYAVSRAGSLIGVKLRPHDLRRTYAGILEESGVPVTDISRLMRHSNVGTTSMYLDRNPRRTTELAAAFSIGLS